MISSTSNQTYRIILILPEFPPYFGGMQTHALYLSNYFAEKGYRIEVLTYQSTDPEVAHKVASFDSQCKFPVRRILSRIGYWHNISLVVDIAQRFRPNLIYASNVFYGFLSQNLNIPIMCRSVGNDLLRPWIAYPYRFGSRLLSHPTFESTAYNWFKKQNFPEWIEALFRRKRILLMQESVKRVSRILANSQFTANVLKNMGIPDKRINIVVGGVDSNRFTRQHSEVLKIRQTLGLPEKGFLLMTACRLVSKKGLDFLLYSFQKLKEIIPDVGLIIVGDGKEREKCHNISRELEITNFVTFTGHISHENIHKYYWSCDLFVLVSRVSHNRLTGMKDVETMGRVLCEANAAGIPVIASNSGGIPSVVTHEENGLLFEESNLGDFLKQVSRLHNNSYLTQHLVQNGLKRAKKQFDWSIVLRQHEKAIAELVV